MIQILYLETVLKLVILHLQLQVLVHLAEMLHLNLHILKDILIQQVLVVITLLLKVTVFKHYKLMAALVLSQKFLTDKQRLGIVMGTTETIGIQAQK